jgi:hypothetical protein
MGSKDLNIFKSDGTNSALSPSTGTRSLFIYEKFLKGKSVTFNHTATEFNAIGGLR